MTLTISDWLALFLHFSADSLLAVGGAISAAPEMHRFLVQEHHWLDDATFANSITVAQAAPGPNVLFVAVMGLNVGLVASGGLHSGWQSLGYALLAAFVCMMGMLLPSGVLTLVITNWAHKNRELTAVKAFKAGVAPIVVGLLVSTGYVLNSHNNHWSHDWPWWLVALISTLLVWKTKIHLLWLLASGAALGALGLLQA